MINKPDVGSSQNHLTLAKYGVVLFRAPVSGRRIIQSLDLITSFSVI